MDRYIKIRLLAIIKSKINDTMATYQRLISDCETSINQTVDKCTTCAAKNCVPRYVQHLNIHSNVSQFNFSTLARQNSTLFLQGDKGNIIPISSHFTNS